MHHPEEAQHYTLAEYWKLVETFPAHKYEFIEGRIRLMAGATLVHAQIEANIVTALNMALRETECNVYSSSANVSISATRYVYPDITVSCDPQDRDTADTLLQPRLVIEVLSPSTEAYDRSEKFGYYRDCSAIEEYVLVDSQQPLVEVYRRESSNLWTLRFFGLHMAIELASIGVRFSVNAVYEKVTFPPKKPGRAEKEEIS